MLKTYRETADVSVFAAGRSRLSDRLQAQYGPSGKDAVPVLRDILAHEYTDNRGKK